MNPLKGAHRGHLPRIMIVSVVILTILGLYMVGLLVSEVNEPVYGETIVDDGIEYEIIPDTVTVTVKGCDDDKTTLDIPSTVTKGTAEYTVVSIDSFAFSRHSNLESVRLPDTVLYIEFSAFKECTGLKSIDLPNALLEIDMSAFTGCSSLESISLPNSLKELGHSTFLGCESLRTVTLSNNPELKQIRASTFKGCTSLESISFPDNIKSLYYDSFRDCTGLKSVDLGSITSLGDCCFFGCSGLTSFKFTKDLTSIGEGVLGDCDGITEFEIDGPNTNYCVKDGVLFDSSITTLIQCPSGMKGDYVMPDTVKKIAGYSFYGCSSLSTVYISSAVTDIGGYAFKDCVGLTGVALPSGVTVLNTSVFEGCTGLSYINLDNITSVGTFAFLGCNNLISAELTKCVNIYISSFEGCTSLKNVTLGDVIKGISSKAFKDCSSLGSIVLNGEITEINSNTFEGCSKLTSVTLGRDIKRISGDAFPFCTALTTINLHDIEFIGYGAFRGCVSLQNADLEMIKNLGYSAFEGCTGLTNVVLHGDLDKIRESTFKGCKSLTSIDISKVKEIGDYAFYGCASLTSISIPAITESIGVSAFAHCSNITAFVVDPTNGNYISKEGLLFDKNLTRLLCCPGGHSGKAVIPKSVTSMDAEAFIDCISLTEIEVETGNQHYASKDGALFNTDLTTLLKYPGGRGGEFRIPNTVTSVADDAFQNCATLTSLVVPSTIPFDSLNIMNSKCPSLKEIVLSDDEDYLSINGAIYSKDGKRFIFCPNGVVSLRLADSMEEFAPGSISGCSVLKEIIIMQGNSLKVPKGSFVGIASDLSFKSGVDGLQLKVYVDESMTTEATGSILNDDWEGTLYFKWIKAPSDDDDDDDDDVVTPQPSLALDLTLVLFAMLFAAVVTGIMIRRSRKP